MVKISSAMDFENKRRIKERLERVRDVRVKFCPINYSSHIS